MKHTLTVACFFSKSAWQAVCRPFSDQFRRLSTLRSGSLCSALAALLLAPLSALNGAEISTDTKPVNLRCENLVNPLGIDATKPRLSWQMQGGEFAARGLKQTAYQVQAASSPEKLAAGEADLWDSGMVSSDSSHLVEWGGKPLVPRQQAWWRVRIWDQDKRESAWSAPATFELGLLSENDWQGKWIRPDDVKPVTNEFTDLFEKYALPMPDAATPRAKIIAGSFQKIMQSKLPGFVLMANLTLDAKPAQARLYCTARGYYEVFINGQAVGDARFEPAETGNAPGGPDNGFGTPYYTAYDVAGLLRRGQNEIRVVLTRGRFHLGHAACDWGQPILPRLRFQLEAGEPNDMRVICASDPSWKFATGPVLKDSFNTGEVCDGRIDPLRGDLKADDPGWKPVKVVEVAEKDLFPPRFRFFPPERVIRKVTAREVFSPADGVWVFDLGEMITGTVEWKAPPGGKAGKGYVFRYFQELRGQGGDDPDHARYYPSDLLIRDGDRMPAFYHEIGIPIWQDRQINWAKANGFEEFASDPENLPIVYIGPTDVYVSSGQSGEVFRSSIRSHPFRYVEVHGLDGAPKPEDLVGLMIHTDMPNSGEFTSSDTDFVQFHDLAVKTFLMNSHGMVTDCWDREKFPYGPEGSGSAANLLYALDTIGMIRKTAADYATSVAIRGRAGDTASPRDSVSVLWASFFISSAWDAYRLRGDTAAFRDNYEAMLKHVRFYFEGESGLGLIMAPQPYGDWLWFGHSSAGAKALGANPPPAWQTFANRASSSENPVVSPWVKLVAPQRMRSFLSTAAMARVVERCSRMAAVLGRKEDLAWLNDLHARLLPEIEKTFFDPVANTFSRQPESGPWGSDVEDSYALFTGVVPAGRRDQVYATMLDGVRKRQHKPITGLISMPAFLQTLAEFGDADDAYEVMGRAGYPGLRNLLQISPDGVCEYFYVDPAGSRKGLASRCHAGLTGAPFPWFYHVLGGLRPDDQQPGFKKFTLAPQIPAKMESAGITHESPYGTVVSRWRQKDGQIAYDVTVPPNSTARVILPKAKADEVRVDETSLGKAAGVSSVRQDGGRVSFDLAAGTYAFGWPAR